MKTSTKNVAVNTLLLYCALCKKTKNEQYNVSAIISDSLGNCTEQSRIICTRAAFKVPNSIFQFKLNIKYTLQCSRPLIRLMC